MQGGCATIDLRPSARDLGGMRIRLEAALLGILMALPVLYWMYGAIKDWTRYRLCDTFPA